MSIRARARLIVPRVVATSVCIAAVALGCGAADEPTQSGSPAAGGSETAASREKPFQPPMRPPDSGPGEAVSMTETLKQRQTLPADYPSDGLVYPDTSPSEVTFRPDGRVFAVFGSPDDFDLVLANIADQVGGQGWTIEQQQAVSTGTLVLATKGERRQTIAVSSFSDASTGDVTNMIAVTIDP